MQWQLKLSPLGRLSYVPAHDELSAGLSSADPEFAQPLAEHFAASTATGLLLLAGPEIKQSLPAELAFWREWGRTFLVAAFQLGEERLQDYAKQGGHAGPKPPDDLTLATLASDAPPMVGLEYLSSDVLRRMWHELCNELWHGAKRAKRTLAEHLQALHPWQHLVGRVTFHLAENKRDEQRPFAFLATFTHRLSAKSKPEHLPLAEALQRYASERDQAKLSEILAPVRAAAAACPWIRELLDSKRLFQAHPWTIAQAHHFLRDVPQMEQAGLVVRVPNWWSAQRPARPRVEVKIGDKRTATLGADTLLDFSVNLALEGEPLTAKEIQELLSAQTGLVRLKGKWVEVDPARLKEALDHWSQLKKEHAGGIDFLEGMRMLSGVSIDESASSEAATAVEHQWMAITAGQFLGDTLRQLRDPSGVKGCQPGEDLNATLRPYQADGVRWLWFMLQLGLGGCLADDMGLGKTIQVIDLLLRLKAAAKKTDQQSPSLLVVPASLLGNWRNELARFAPQLKPFFAHPSETPNDELAAVAGSPQKLLKNFDVVLTSYSMVRRLKWLSEVRWQLVVLDEAQAIKNAAAIQSRSVKQLQAPMRLVLTGTPVENHLGDLWSLFDFCSPGLLGNASQFKKFVGKLNKQRDAHAYGALRRLVRPYILRRMKTDPHLVPDLPDKIEMPVECGLSRKQAVLYETVVTDLAKQLSKVDGIQRKGIVLSTLMQLKQVCNHPDQFSGEGGFDPAASGKFQRLATICQDIDARQEKVLVFTQFQTMCQPLADHLERVFGRPGIIMHGGTAVGKRKELVRQFQEDEQIPFFVLSLKVGGTGLNLTAASHVVHFDRWWNPAVENQATDRAFRIGQTKNVLVHKFVCRGTLEERIDQAIREKQQLADQILGGEADQALTQMSDQELLRFVSIDVNRAVSSEP